MTLNDIIAAVKLDISDFQKKSAELKDGFAKLNKSIESDFNKSVANAGLKMGAIGVAMTTAFTVPIMAIVHKAIPAAVEFGNAMTNVAAHSNLTSKELQTLGEFAGLAAKKFSNLTETQAAQGMEKLASAGQSMSTIMANLPAVLNLASAAQMDVASTAEIVVQTMLRFNMETTEATRVADVFAAAEKNGLASTAELASLMRYMATTMMSAGYSFEETTAYVVAFSNAGLVARQASGALSTAIQAMTNMSKEGSDILAKYGVALKDSTGKVRPFIDVVTDLKAAGASSTDMLRVFGDSATAIITVLTNMGKLKFDALTKQLKDSGGAASDTSDTLNTGLGPAIARIGKTMGEIYHDIGMQIAPFVEKIANGMTKVAEAVRGVLTWFSGLSEESRNLIGIFIGVLAATGPLLTIIVSLGVVLTAAGKVFGLTIGAFGGWLIAIMAVVTGIIWLITNWEKLCASVAKNSKTLSGMNDWRMGGAASVRGSGVGMGDLRLAEGVTRPVIGMGDLRTAEGKYLTPPKPAYVPTDAEQAAIDARVDATKDALDAIAELELDKTQNALRLLKQETDAWREAGVDEVTIAKYTALKSKEIWQAYYDEVAALAQERWDAEVSAVEGVMDAQLTAFNAISELKLGKRDYALQLLEQEMEGWRLAGVTEVQIAEYTALKKAAIWKEYNDEQAALELERKEKSEAEWEDYNGHIEDLASSLSDFLGEKYRAEYDAKQDALDKGLDATLDALDKERDAVDTRYDEELNWLDEVTARKVGGIDMKLTALKQEYAGEKAKAEMLSLYAELEAATTPEEAIRINEKIAAIQRENEYQTRANELEWQKANIIAQADEKRIALQTDRERELASIEARTVAVEASYQRETDALSAFYTEKMLQRNRDAEAQLLMETMTHQSIITMMETQLGDYARMGKLAGDSWWSAYQAAIIAAGGAAVPPAMYAPPADIGKIPSYASGGWAGLNGAEVIRVGERGPEYISSEPPSAGNELLRGILVKLDELIGANRATATQVGAVISGLGRF